MPNQAHSSLFSESILLKTPYNQGWDIETTSNVKLLKIGERPVAERWGLVGYKYNKML